MKRLGLDIGSTTVKCVLVDEDFRVLYTAYERHYSRMAEVAGKILSDLVPQYPDETFSVTVTGSAGMGYAEKLGIPFVQEVYAERLAAGRLHPGTDAVIELGGEDAKILFLTNGFEMRMNGTCAGGTGAFIDQMATLLQMTPDEMNEAALGATDVCQIASRCGVFAKSDIQPLLNQGVEKNNIAAGIFHAVVCQTVGGLAQGRRITGNVLYLGGPLTFLPALRADFDKVLGLSGICPENALFYVAVGATFAGIGKDMTLDGLRTAFLSSGGKASYSHTEPLFATEAEYEDFQTRHRAASEGIRELDAPTGEMFLGIDAGSTTVKLALCDAQGNLFRPFYAPNNGQPVDLILTYLTSLYRDFPDIRIAASAVTGYGEELVKAAFSVDMGIVETIAHYTAAKKFRPDVDFILDVGGQDIKCFKIKNGAIDNLYLNEACSSGCGSFLQTFAAALGYSGADFAKLGLFAKAPVSLGSRCTVFMNSAVKQAQKDGARVEDIAAGLSVSVVKNALYKVIRCADASSLGKNIVVQGGTFLNDCVLRAFEKETGQEVIRPKYAALMGAYGAALYALEHRGAVSGILDAAGCENFKHEVRRMTCGGCQNHCHLTVNTFSGGRRTVAGNRCSKPTRPTGTEESVRNLYAYKQELFDKLRTVLPVEGRETVGIPMGLNNYELLPFWHAYFSALSCNVLVSPASDRALYVDGQHTIPSDTACYPAKLMHGHIEWLIRRKPDFIFYPDMSYNTEEGLGINHFNCPVVAYYPQVLKLNVADLAMVPFVCDFLSLADKKQFAARARKILSPILPGRTRKDFRVAAECAFAAYENYLADVRAKADEFLADAEKTGKPVIVLAGRPYHVDPEVNHGIDKLLCSLGATVISEDSISNRMEPFAVHVRNQWTYHARLYAAAKYIASLPRQRNIQLVQLVSFGCGVDAVTTDEVRSILEEAGRLYTQIKIDEISNMGAVTIRLRSLFAILEEKRGENAVR